MMIRQGAASCCRRRRQVADEGGQAAVEFVFFFLAVVFLLMFMMTMFFFAQDFFQGITQARYDTLEDFRQTVPYEVGADRAYTEVIRIRLQSFPFMERFTSGIPPVVKRTRLVGGAKPPYTVPGAVECGAAAALVAIQAGTDNDTGPGAWAGAGIGAAACGVYAIW
jgi:hypothetical protein